MGWLFTPGSDRKTLIAERAESWERTLGNSVEVKSVCLAHCYRGNSFTGVLWSVWERTFANHDGDDKYKTQRWIQCDLLRFDRCNDGWGYKDMEESMHPYYYSCPLKYLEMVPIDQFGGNEEWRQIVREHHEQRRAKRREKQITTLV